MQNAGSDHCAAVAAHSRPRADEAVEAGRAAEGPTKDEAPSAETKQTSSADANLWNSLEVAKLFVPVLSAVLLALAGIWISKEVNQSNLAAAEQARVQSEFLPDLIGAVGNAKQIEDKNGVVFDGRGLTKARPQPFLRIYMKGNAVVEGWPLDRAFPSSGYEIYLSPACNIDGGKASLIRGPGVFVLGPTIERIELIDRTTSACAEAFQKAPG